MASASFQSVRTHLSEFRNNSDRDTLSEPSESGTSTSVASQDIQEIALILGINNVEDVFQEKFRVDRRRLETMLSENLEESQTAQAFFHRVEEDTSTVVNWPTRLKIGAKSKKDPHVRVAGRAEDVKLAKEKIMQLLDTRSNRVTMKIDVSYTDHSHIIGKGGQTIKRVMEETGCHIHFPDSNRTSALEKSNQVSIAGDMEKVERARARVRSLTPLVFTFELPVVANSHSLPDLSSPQVHHIQEQYNVQVMVRNRPRLHANQVVVKGVQWEVRATMEATRLLMRHMCGAFANQTKVQMTLEISPMHHQAVVGLGADQLKMIVRGTGAQIMFPDATDPNVPLLKKSCVTISGRIQDVYAARQQLVGSLPVAVIFDVSDEALRIDEDGAARLMQRYNVYINIRHKPRQGIASVVIRGIERCAGDIYEARRELLGGREPVVAAEIPESFNIPLLAAQAPPLPFNNMFHPFSPTQMQSQSSTYQENMANLPSPYQENMMPNMPSPFNPHSSGGYPSPLSPLAPTPPAFPAWMVPSPQPQPAPFHFPSSGYNDQSAWNPMSGGPEVHHPSMVQPIVSNYQPLPDEGRPITLNQILNSSCQASSSGYQSNFTGSCVSLDTNNLSGGAGSNSSPLVSPISKKSASPAPSSEIDRSQQELASIMCEMPLSERRAPGCEKKTLETRKMSPNKDYRYLKAEAEQAMRENVGAASRVPTPRWSGHYFSRTSPAPITLDNPPNTPDNSWNRDELMTRPNVTIVETAPTPPSGHKQDRQCHYKQLQELLRDVGLHKYIELFQRHELDMSTFASLSESDLIEIGVSAFGARRKMVMMIQELQNNVSKNTATPTGEKLISSPPHYNTSAITQDKW